MRDVPGFRSAGHILCGRLGDVQKPWAIANVARMYAFNSYHYNLSLVFVTSNSHTPGRATGRMSSLFTTMPCALL